MFGFSFGEIVVLLIVGVLVVGPRRLPAMLRTAGGWIAKLRRVTTDLRSQSGIDDLIRQEGLEREIRELRSLSRVNVIETLVSPVIGAATAGSVVSATPRVRPPEAAPPPPPPPEPIVQPLREREYPVLGCDSYGAEIALESDDSLNPANEPAGGASELAKAEPTPAASTDVDAGTAHAGGTSELAKAEPTPAASTDVDARTAHAGGTSELAKAEPAPAAETGDARKAEPAPAAEAGDALKVEPAPAAEAGDALKVEPAPAAEAGGALKAEPAPAAETGDEPRHGTAPVGGGAAS